MELEEAIKILEQVQELITPVVNICAEDLAEKDCLEELFRG